MSDGKRITLSFGGRKLKNADVFSKSDPYLVISRPSYGGDYTVIRKTETIKNSLNPDWDDFYFMDSDLAGHDRNLNLKLEVYDDDGGNGKDKLIGQAWQSLKCLEAASLVKPEISLTTGKGKDGGHLLVRTFKEHNEGGYQTRSKVLKNVTLGIGAKQLKNMDTLSKSDPYLVISVPSPTGGFKQLKVSETKKNTLNPDWNDFYITEVELEGVDRDLNLKFEVFDDDGKEGQDKRDDSIGTCWQSLRLVEAFSLRQAEIPLAGRKGNVGRLVIRTFKEHEEGA